VKQIEREADWVFQTSMRILVIDDDDALAQALVAHLTTQHHVVDVVSSGSSGWDYTQAATYDLIVLDVNLPDVNGIQFCQRLRRNNYTCPVLLLTAKGDSTEKVMGLDAGADDYVVKPCTFEEIGARIRALLRRQSSSGAPVLTWGQLCLDPSSCLVTYNHEPLAISPKEYGLLELFLRNPQRIFSSSLILEHLWGFEDTPGEETVRTHIKRLRRRLKAVGAEDMIETIYGMGYRLRAPETESASRSEQARVAAAEAWERLKGATLERLAVLDQAVAALERGALSPQLRQTAEQAAHKIAGSLGMFGFPKGSQLGRELEVSFQQPPEQDFPLQVQSLVSQLHEELQRSPLPLPANATNGATPLLSASPSDRKPVVLMVDDDASLLQQFREAAAYAKISMETALSVADARAYLTQRVPDAVLLDLAFPDGAEKGLELLEELHERFPSLPILLFTGHDHFRDRLAAVRRSKHRFISKTTPPDQVLDMIRDSLKPSPSSTITLLAVDDDVVILDRLQSCLPQWGIYPITLSDPNRFWETLETVMPDVLILDIEMPDINGIELCQVVRSDNAWNDLPILFLSSRWDADTIHRIYDAGADDYVPKPFAEPELVTRIFNRIERNQLLRTLAETDHLTGIANRRQAIKEMNRYLNLTQRYHQPLCVVIIDLDNFKRVNDQYGHDMGDRVLRRVAHIFQHMSRGEDVVARWGGEEFLIGMYGITKQQAKERMTQFLSIVKQELFTSPENGESFHITFSAGIAMVPEDGRELHHLCRLADQALYQAKEQGRECIVCT